MYTFLVILKVVWTLALNIVIRNFWKSAIWTHCICVSIDCMPWELARFCHWLPLGNQRQLLYNWKFLPNSAHWLLLGHVTSNNETVARQNLWAGSIAKSMTSEGNGTLLIANVDLRPPLQRGVMNSQLYNKSLEDWSLGKQNIAKSMTSMGNSIERFHSRGQHLC